jgi:hypothetical protein
VKQAGQELSARQVACGAEHYDDVRLCAAFVFLSSLGFRSIRHVHDRNQGWSDSHLAEVNILQK